jgi:hypothetical protein
MEILIGVFVGLLFFICTITAYIFGIKHGRTIKNDGVPNINPVKAYKVVKNDIKQDKQLDLFAEGLNNILSYGEHVEAKKERR